MHSSKLFIFWCNITPGAVRGCTRGLMACRGLGQGQQAGLWLLVNHNGDPLLVWPMRSTDIKESVVLLHLSGLHFELFCQHSTGPHQSRLHLWVGASSGDRGAKPGFRPGSRRHRAGSAVPASSSGVSRAGGEGRSTALDRLASYSGRDEYLWSFLILIRPCM